MNLKELQNFYVNGRVMSEETVLNITQDLLNTQKAGWFRRIVKLEHLKDTPLI